MTGLARFEWPIVDEAMSLRDLKREALERAGQWLIDRAVLGDWAHARFHHQPAQRTLKLTVPTLSQIRPDEGEV